MSENDPWAPTPEALDASRQKQDAPKEDTKPKPKIPADPSSAQRRANLAVGGKLAQADTLPNNPFPGYDLDALDYEIADLSDAADLQAVMGAILISRKRLYIVTQLLSQAQRRAVEAKYEWKTALARNVISVTGGTEKERFALSELKVTAEWGAFLAAEQEAEDAINLLRAVRTELDSLQNMSYNIRAQMQMM